MFVFLFQFSCFSCGQCTRCFALSQYLTREIIHLSSLLLITKMKEIQLSDSIKTTIFTQNKRSGGRQSTASSPVFWIFMASSCDGHHVKEEVVGKGVLPYLWSYLFSYQVSKCFPRSPQSHSLIAH